jgi:threonyl-tRNA synthetase
LEFILSIPRIEIDDRNETMGYKTRQIQKGKIPYMLVIGDRERDSESVNIRGYGEKGGKTLALTDLVELFDQHMLDKMPVELRH